FGGHNDDESKLACAGQCVYNKPYSVLSYKLGFAFIRDGNSKLPPGKTIQAHMPQNRKDLFHYGLFGHSLAGPFGIINGLPAPKSAEPRTTSGIGDLPGGGFMVTFGGWRSDLPDVDMRGDVKQQAGTIMHELGHNLNLRHAGWFSAPQCGANYPSVMSYS